MKPKPQAAPPARPRGYFVLGIIFTIVAVGVWFLINRENVQEFTKTYKNREQARIEIAQTKQRIAQLKRQQQSLAFNGVESVKQIRERLQYHKLGEKVVFFVKEDMPSTATHSATALPDGATTSTE